MGQSTKTNNDFRNEKLKIQRMPRLPACQHSRSRHGAKDNDLYAPDGRILATSMSSGLVTNSTEELSFWPHHHQHGDGLDSVGGDSWQGHSAEKVKVYGFCCQRTTGGKPCLNVLRTG